MQKTINKLYADGEITTINQIDVKISKPIKKSNVLNENLIGFKNSKDFNNN